MRWFKSYQFNETKQIQKTKLNDPNVQQTRWRIQTSIPRYITRGSTWQKHHRVSIIVIKGFRSKKGRRWKTMEFVKLCECLTAKNQLHIARSSNISSYEQHTKYELMITFFNAASSSSLCFSRSATSAVISWNKTKMLIL